MLSPIERERLLKRNSKDMDSQIRASNDSRARKKLKAWLNEDLVDVFLCLRMLPNDQLRKVFKDGNVYPLFDLVEAVLRIRDFRPITGKIEDPLNWKVVGRLDELNQPNRTVEDIDIWRALLLSYRINKLSIFCGHDNPISSYGMLAQMDAVEEFRDRVTVQEREGLDRIKLALKNVSEELLRESDAQTREWDRRLNPPDGTMGGI